MKKSVVVILIVILCAAGWAGATYVTGCKMESRYFNLLKQYGHLGPLTLSKQSYVRGFLTSRAETVLELKVPQRPPQAGRKTQPERLQLVFEETFHHGPLPIGGGPDGQTSLAPALALVETRLVSVSPGQKEFAALLAKVPELKNSLALTRIGFDGSLTSRIQIPPFDKAIDDNQVSWGGFQFESEFAPAKKTLVGNFELPKMKIHSAESEVTWNGIQGRFDLNEALPLLYVGTSKMAFGAMELSLPNKKTGQHNHVLMKGLEISSDSRCDGKLVQYNQSMKFAGVTVGGQTYGPGICNIEAKNLDAQGLGNFQSRIQQVYRSETDFNPEELLPRLLPIYRQLLTKLLTGNPEVNIRQLHFATPMGDIDGKVLVKFAGRRGLNMDDPKALLQYLDVAADVSIHKSLVTAMLADNIKAKLKVARAQGTIQHYSDQEIDLLAGQQVDRQLDALVAQNYLVREGETIRAQATFKQEELVLNGRSLPLFQAR